LHGKKTQALAELLDLFPTLVDACKLPQPEGLEGVSLMPVVRGEQASVQDAAFTQHPRPGYYDREPSGQPSAMGCSVRTGNIRYTEWRDWKTGETVARELYDHEGDPTELQNAVDDPKFDEARRQAAALLLKQFPPTKHP
jgi:iduronate 2-sulfatase